MSNDDVPRVIVFDLDGTLWNPEMYQLWGGGAPFKKDPSNIDAMIDRSGTKVRLIGETREVLQMLHTDPAYASTHLAISSTCDEPHWANELLNLFTFETVENGEKRPCTMKSLFGDFIEIYYANKSEHHKTILKKVKKEDKSVTDFSDMLFFDNQQNNIGNVSRIGVTSVYCSNGMTAGTFERGIAQWRRERQQTQKNKGK